MEILLTGDPITASEALAIGLINRVVPHADLMPTARAIAKRICRNGPLAVRMIKQAVLEAYNHPWAEAFAIESRVSLAVLASDDAKEGPRAFAEKREPGSRGADPTDPAPGPGPLGRTDATRQHRPGKPTKRRGTSRPIPGSGLRRTPVKIADANWVADPDGDHGRPKA